MIFCICRKPAWLGDGWRWIQGGFVQNRAAEEPSPMGSKVGTEVWMEMLSKSQDGTMPLSWPWGHRDRLCSALLGIWGLQEPMGTEQQLQWAISIHRVLQCVKHKASNPKPRKNTTSIEKIFVQLQDKPSFIHSGREKRLKCNPG